MAAPRGRPALLALLLAAAAVVFQCFLPPTVGLANDGDFAKVTGHFDFGNPFGDQDLFRFADNKYIVDRGFHNRSGFYSSELLLFAAALGLTSLSDNPDTFDLRLMGAVHAGLFF